MPKIENEVRHFPEQNETHVTITRRNGNQLLAIFDYDAWRAFWHEFHYHMKRSRTGRDEWFPAFMRGELSDYICSQICEAIKTRVRFKGVPFLIYSF